MCSLRPWPRGLCAGMSRTVGTPKLDLICFCFFVKQVKSQILHICFSGFLAPKTSQFVFRPTPSYKEHQRRTHTHNSPVQSEGGKLRKQRRGPGGQKVEGRLSAPGGDLLPKLGTVSCVLRLKQHLEAQTLVSQSSCLILSN